MGIFDKGESQTYPFKDPSNGVYAFLLDGAATIEGQPLQKRDGFGVWNTDKIEITANEKSRILLMEVPMEIGG